MKTQEQNPRIQKPGIFNWHQLEEQEKTWSRAKTEPHQGRKAVLTTQRPTENVGFITKMNLLVPLTPEQDK